LNNTAWDKVGAWACLNGIFLYISKKMKTKVTKLKSAVRINAACLDLCKNGAKESAEEGNDVASARKKHQVC